MDKVFDKIAARYDTPDRIEMAKIITDKIKGALSDTKGKTFLDYGGGTGLVSLPLANLVQELVIIDSSEQMIQLTQAKIEDGNFSNTTAKVGDLLVEDYGESVYDCVILSLVLLHIPDTASILAQLNRILKKNGQLILVDFVKNQKVSHPKVHNGFEKDELKAALEKAGFVLTNFEPFYDGKEIFMRQDATLFIATASKN
ncbi:hypothetical protein IGI37_001811 [Enterococcus sp. AZ194]|uniref:class I SAM-dependent methyltransferase n=1 Tax=Enterococcus sp. AZ194 TaxID=2774629 RepID=UPI003F24354D